MATVKNTAKGPRGIRTEDGELVMIDAGQSATGDFPASEVKAFKAMLAYEAGEQPEAAAEGAEGEGDKPFAKMNRSELDAAVEKAKATGFELPADADTNKKIAEALQAHADKA